MKNKDLDKLLASGIHLTSPAALAQILTRGEYSRPRHVDFINEYLVRTYPGLGDLRRLVIEAPSGCGKSSLVSIWYVLWRLALNPKERIGIVSHTFGLAREWGLKTKQLVQDYLPELGIEINEDSQAAHRWSTKEGGGVVCVGIDGNIVGNRLHCLVIDDPFATAAEAESITNQESVWKWYQRTAYSRLEPGAAIVIIHQRWSLGDLIGRLRDVSARGPEAEGYDDYTFVSLPSIAIEGDQMGRKVGEALWPEKYPLEELARIRRGMTEYPFSAIHQQNPLTEGGGLIKNTWWKYYKPAGSKLSPVRVDGKEREVIELPEDFDMVLQSWDMNHADSVRAYLHGRQPDAVAGHVWGRKGPNYFLLDRFYSRCGIEETIVALREMSVKWPQAVAKLIEYTANGPTVMRRLEHEISGLIPVNPRGSKKARAQAHVAVTDDEKYTRVLTMLGAIESGNFYLPHPGYRSFTEEYRNLMGQFPHGGKDDGDATSQAWAKLASGEWRDIERAARAKVVEPMNLQEMFRKNIRTASENRIKNKGRKAEDLWFRSK